MKKFNFRLQPVLNLRKMREDQKKLAVGELQNQINDQQRQALELSQAIQQNGQELKKQYQQGTVNLDWIAHYRSFVTHTQQAINQRVKKVAEIQQQLTLARCDLAEAAKQRKILEKLREKRKQRYDVDLAKNEANQQDEISTNMFLRNNPN